MPTTASPYWLAARPEDQKQGVRGLQSGKLLFFSLVFT
jgi:hypothetical protein